MASDMHPRDRAMMEGRYNALHRAYTDTGTLSPEAWSEMSSIYERLSPIMEAEAAQYEAETQPTIRARTPTTQEAVAGYIGDKLSDFLPNSSSRSFYRFGHRAADLLDLLPYTGTLMAGDQARRDYNEGNYGSAALNAGFAALDALPFVGAAARSIPSDAIYAGRSLLEGDPRGLLEAVSPTRPRQSLSAMRTDNPGGRWLEGKVRAADEYASTSSNPFAQTRLYGSPTGYYDEVLDLPVSRLFNVKGSVGELRYPGEAQYDALAAKVAEEGWNPTPILVGVNDRGVPYVIEGNTRLALARNLGEQTIPAEVKYFIGGEDVADMRFSPDRIRRFERQPETPASLPPLSDAQRTQIAGTLPTETKAADILGPSARGLDDGAGLGLGARELGFDAFEPFPREGFIPTYTDPSAIPSQSYDRLTNFNVLNVVPREVRDDIVEDIGRVIAPGGRGLITTRGRDVLTAKGVPGPEPMSLITSRDTYQKGFRQQELQDYLRYILGSNFEVRPQRLGPAGAEITRVRR